MTKLITVFYILLLLPLCSVASDYSFKSYHLRSDISQVDTVRSDHGIVKNLMKFHCRNSTEPLAEKICSLQFQGTETIAGKDIYKMFLYYYEDKLHSINIIINESDFNQVISALITKYGAGITEDEVLQNNFGTMFKNTNYSWIGKESRLRASRYISDIEHSSITFETIEIEELYKNRKESRSSLHSADL